MKQTTSREVVWLGTTDVDVPYEASVDGQRWTLRLNDFPAEPLYTLLIDGAPEHDVEDWPGAWRRPA